MAGVPFINRKTVYRILRSNGKFCVWKLFRACQKNNGQIASLIALELAEASSLHACQR